MKIVRAPDPAAAHAPAFGFIAGDLALDFVNTVSDRLDAARVADKLVRVEDVAAWCRAAGLPLEADWPARAGRDARALASVHRLREDLHALFHARIDTRPPAPAALARLDRLLHRCQAARALAIGPPMLAWRWRRHAAVDELLHPIALAAVALLTSARGSAIAVCEGSGCGWLFLDASPSRRRRWCSMADCGNRAKAREHYRRHRQRCAA